MVLRGAFSTLKEKVKLIIKKIFISEIYTEGKEPPKSYAYDKKFYGIYTLFLIYSFIILFAINFPGTYLDVLTLGNPFAFSNALIALFLVLSLMYSSTKIVNFMFERFTVIKQVVLYVGIIIGFFILFSYILTTDLNFMSYLLGLSTIWLILLSTRFYMYSRKFATKLEARFISKYSPFRRMIAFITPYIILTILVVLALFYRSFLVFLSLDFFAINAPAEAVYVYNIEMRLIMPLIYFSLILTLLFIIFEFVFTRRRAETKRAGLFDNYTFSLIVLFIFFFQIFQLSMYLILSEDVTNALKVTIGTTSNTVWWIIFVEFAVSMYFLYRIVRKLGRTLGWRFLIFKRDGLILLILGCVFSQTVTRFALQSEISNQEINIVGQYFMADKYVVSILMIIFLGLTLLICYLKPHETSMFIRLQKETVDEEEESMNIIYKLIKSEYIRRGDSYPLEILERELIKATKLPKKKIYSMINKLAAYDMNIIITNKRGSSGEIQKIVDFTSVTEKFDKKGIAAKKAKKYLSERLYQTMASNRTHLNLKTNKDSGEASRTFLSSLSEGYSKKQRDLKDVEKKQKDASLTFLSTQVPTSLRKKLLDILKKEYAYRIENDGKYPDFYFSISEIADQVQQETKITPGELYPIMETLNSTDIEVTLLPNPNEPEDKYIRIFPIADDDLIYSVASFRPKEYETIRIEVTNNFMKCLKRKKNKANLIKLRKGIKKDSEEQKFWNILLKELVDYFPIYTETQEMIQKGENLNKVIKVFPKSDVDIYKF